MTPAEQLREHGYAVFEEYLDPAAAATLRERLRTIGEPVRPDTLYEPDTRELADWAAVSASGLALRGFAGRHPELLDRYLRPPSSRQRPRGADFAEEALCELPRRRSERAFEGTIL